MKVHSYIAIYKQIKLLLFSSLTVILILILTADISKSQTASNFKLTSTAFKEGKAIPAKYTCDSVNISPALSWSGAPANTKSFAIIMDDPDAPMGTWVHWVMYNIPGAINSLEEKIDVTKVNATEGVNSWGEKGYNGPCPPGGTHQYVFKLFALDKLIKGDGMSQNEIVEAMKGHIIGETTLVGLFRE